MALYWTTSALYGLTQHITLRTPTVRRALGIPKTPSEVARPLPEALQRLRAASATFWADVREKNKQ